MVEYLQIKTSQEPALIIKYQNYHYFATTQASQTSQIFKGRSKPMYIRSQFAVNNYKNSPWRTTISQFELKIDPTLAFMWLEPTLSHKMHKRTSKADQLSKVTLQTALFRWKHNFFDLASLPDRIKAYSWEKQLPTTRMRFDINMSLGFSSRKDNYSGV